MGWRVKESTMSSDVDVQPAPVNKNTIRTRGGVTGHNERALRSRLRTCGDHHRFHCYPPIFWRCADLGGHRLPPASIHGAVAPTKSELMARVGMTEKNEPSARKGWCFYPRVQAGTENNSISIEPSHVRCVGPVSTRWSSRRLHVVIRSRYAKRV